MAFMGFWGTGVEPGTQYTEKVSCTVWKMMMIVKSQDCALDSETDTDRSVVTVSSPSVSSRTGYNAKVAMTNW